MIHEDPGNAFGTSGVCRAEVPAFLVQLQTFVTGKSDLDWRCRLDRTTTERWPLQLAMTQLA